MNKEVTCAIVIINKDGDILGCHGTGKPDKNGYDFPKGCHDAKDKDELATAVRELREETGISLTIREIDSLIDCGTHAHTKGKDLHIFMLKVNTFPEIDTLKCTSYFEWKYGKKLPEVNGYKIIKKEERSTYFYRILQDKFDIIDKYNK